MNTLVDCGKELIAQHKRKEIGFEDVCAQNATIIADNLDRVYRPAQYTPLAGDLQEYVEGRLAENARPRDEKLGARLGVWSMYVRKVMYANAGDIETLLWAAEKLESKKLDAMAKACRARAGEYSAVHSPYEYEDVLRVQEMDCRDRQRLERGRA